MNYIKKNYTFIFLISFTSIVNNIYSQNSVAYGHACIDVSDKLTTHLIFEDDIDYIDIGAVEFSVGKLKNIVKIKYNGLEGWDINKRTNLTVVTKSGLYYSLWVYYKKKPTIKTYVYKPEDSYKLDSFDILNKKKLFIKHCNYLSHRNSNIIKEFSNHKMKYQINGIFYKNDKIILRLKIENQSKINFTTDSIRFWLTTKRKFNILKSLKKAEAIQYNEKNARFVCNNTKDISAESSQTILFGFDRFVPTDQETLEIRITENNSGGRRGKIVLDIKDFLFRD